MKNFQVRVTYDDSHVITISDDGTICLWQTESKEKYVEFFDEQLIGAKELSEMYYIYRNHSKILAKAKATHKYTLNQHVCSNEKLLHELHEGYIGAMVGLRNEIKVRFQIIKIKP
jgi:hypothetical protein